MRTVLTVAMLLAACTTPAPAAASPDYVERQNPETFDRPAIVTVPATRGEPIQATEPPVELFVPPADWECTEWFSLSLDAGFTIDDWPALGTIIWRESRCNPDAHNQADPAGGSRGLTQINGFWCRPHRWEPNSAGYLGAAGVLTNCEELFDPYINLRAARAVVQYDLDRGRCPWTQWSTRRGLCG